MRAKSVDDHQLLDASRIRRWLVGLAVDGKSRTEVHFPKMKLNLHMDVLEVFNGLFSFTSKY